MPALADQIRCELECKGDPACEIAMADCFIEKDRVRDAIIRLKVLVQENPDVQVFARMLAKAYLADNNYFWAQRTLVKSLLRDPDNCISRSWLAWIHVTQGDLDLAKEVLGQTGCPGPGPESARWSLLRAFIDQTADKPLKASEALELALKAGALFPEDEGLWLFLRSAHQPGWIEPINLRLEMSAGYTSNAKAGSPTDPGTSGPSSALGRLSVFGRFVWPTLQAIRPVLEVGFKGHGITADAASDLSYMEMSARPGILLRRNFPRVLVAYKADLLLLNQEDKQLFYEGHRAEVELDTGDTMFFAGAGRRIFTQSGRTRWEFDGGLGGSLSSGPVRILLATSLRYYKASGGPYDLIGGTGLGVARLGLGAGLSIRLGATVGLDYYLNSGAERGELAYGTKDKRLDVLTKLSMGLWGPTWAGFRIGIDYEFSWRESTADISTDNYDYQEHRLLFKTRFAFDLNPWAPEIVTPKDHIELGYGIEARSNADLDNERIQDLLRQDEAAKRGSSCVE